MKFCLEAYAKTRGQSASKADITPKKFKVGQCVKHVNPDTLLPHQNEFTILRAKMYGDTWFYETLPGVWTNEEFLIEGS